MKFNDIRLVYHHTPDEVIDKIVRVAGLAFLEEPWTKEMLRSMDWIEQGSKLERDISDGIFRGEIEECIDKRCPCAYYTSDMNGVMVAYLSSELPDNITWEDLEEAGFARGAYSLMSTEQLKEWQDKEELLDTSFVWDYPSKTHADDNSDFMHILSFAVSPEAQGTGVATRLMRPFLELADKLEIPVYLECLSDRLESLYTHYGFEVIERYYVEGVEIHERIMVYGRKQAKEKASPEKCQ